MEYKTCTKCGQSLRIHNFYKRYGRYKETGKRQSWCKECSNTSSREISRKKFRQHKLEAMVLLGGRCSICGYDKHPAALDFHHKSEKEFGIGERLREGILPIKEELEKCALLCANCHRVHHTDWEVL